jgi:hypothetical protein
MEAAFVVFAIVAFVLWVIFADKKKKGKSGAPIHPWAIPDKFSSLGEVREALRGAGLESSDLIVGVDFTKSNEWQGRRTFGGKCLHATVKGRENPYQRVLRIMGGALQHMDDDNFIPAYGFGDSRTTDSGVFSLTEQGACRGMHDVLLRYGDVAKHVSLSGPTNFGPLIRKAVEVVKETRKYHILVIIADGAVNCKADTVKAIVEASNHPLSIIMVGVGDGPWDMMEEFDDELPSRRFDNFQFVDFHSIMHKAENPEVTFALHALMEIPDQYKAISRLGLL